MAVAQTSVAGTPGTPLTVSASVSGPHADGGPDLRAATHALRAALTKIRDEHRSRGWSPHDSWVFLRETPDQRQDSKVFRTGKVPQRTWDESVTGVPGTYDTVQLTANFWGGLRLKAPSLSHPGPPWREVRAWVEVPAEGAAATADALVAWLSEAVATPGATHGFVHVDSVADPYGDLVVELSRFASAGLHGRVEGYYWCLALGPPALVALGGRDELEASGVCQVVEPADVGGQEGALCHLTGDPLDLTAERVLAWRSVLAPLLRPGIPGRLDYLAPGMPLSRPVWLFEGPPAPAMAPGLLAHGAPPPRRTLTLADTADGATLLVCTLTTDGSGRPAGEVAAAVSGAVGAWCRTARAGELGPTPAIEVTASPVTGEGTSLTWTLEADRPVEPAARELLADVLQGLADELARPGESGPGGPALGSLTIAPA